MTSLIIGIVIALIIGIIFLSDESQRKDVRQRHLDELVRLLDAEMEEIPGRKNSFALRFDYRKVSFLYEDIEEVVFDKIGHRAFLRLQLPVNFNVVFTEEMKNAFSAARTSGGLISRDTNRVESPRGFKEFHIYSNKPDIASALFEDDAVVRVFLKYKSKDVRGKPELALEIVDGVLVQKFYPLGIQLEPTIFDLRNNASLIENFLEDMLVIYRQVTKVAEGS